MISKIEPDAINIIDERWKESALKNAHFIDEMDVERVLSGFRRTCGIGTGAEPYGGWENSLIAGHAAGHYFSALAMRIASSHDERSEEKAKLIIAGLKECQEKSGNGFLSAATVQDEDNPYIQFDILEGKAEGKQWVPWYALHKVLQGLMDLWITGRVKEAEDVVLSLADWVSDRVLSWDKDTRDKVITVEYGGMNDSLYQLYLKTHEDKYLKTAGVFDEPLLYAKLIGGRDRMKGVHANTTIPKILGYLTGAIAYKEAGDRDEYSDRLETAKRFYDAVIENQTYATGGIGDMEHFFADGLLDASRTQCNAESCCCYNMMKLSGLLFMMTGETKYIEYTEKTLWNARLGSIGPEGGYTYFNPMGTGYYRLYSPAKPEDNPFWCCVGTGMEDFASFADKICYVEDRTLIITQWISSDMTLGDERYELRADHKKGKLSLSGTGGNVKLRIPAWIKNRDRILPEKSDYLDISFEKDRTFELDFDMEISLLSLPDEPAAKGFSYGPFVLCVPLGKDKWGITENAGIEVSAPAWKVVFGESYKGSITYGKTTRKVLDSEYLTLPKGETIESFSKGFRKYIIVKDDSLYLSGLSDCNGNELELPLIPYYLTGNMRYGIYWYFSSPNPGAKASVSPVTLNKKDT